MVRALLAGSADAGGRRRRARRPSPPPAALLAGGPVTVVLGRPNLAESADGVVAAASAIHAAHPEVRFLSALRRGNVHGALDMGLAPGLLPGSHDPRRRPARGSASGAGRPCPPPVGLDATGILEAAADGKIDVLVLLGADPLADFPDTDLATRALAGARTVIAVDRFLTASAQQADVVLAAAGPAEVDGTTTNIEGRVSTVGPQDHAAGHGPRRLDARRRAQPPARHRPRPRVARPDPRGDRRRRAQPRRAHPGAWSTADGGRDGLARRRRAALRSEDGPTPPALLAFAAPTVAEAPAVDAYSLRLVATRKLYDLGTDVQHAPGLAGLTSDTVLRLHPHDFDRLGVDAGAVVTVTSSTGSATLPVEPDPAVGRGAAAVVLHQPGPQVGALIDATATVTEVRVVKA